MEEREVLSKGLSKGCGGRELLEQCLQEKATLVMSDIFVQWSGN